MPEKEMLVQLYEAVLTHQALLRDVKLQVESLKRMMFEHRPQFVPVFEMIEASVAESEPMRQLEAYSRQIEQTLQKLRA
jgi:hypothetical protein